MAIRLLGIASILLPLALAGCSDDDGDSVTVAIHGSQYDPATLTVPAGTTVTWVNHDSFQHTATSSSWDSGEMGQDEEFRQPMDDPGTFTYSCAFHPSMRGTIIVE